MSTLVKSCKFDYLSNRVEDFFSDDDDDGDDFNFKYVPTSQFNNIVKDVRRQRSRKDEERVWTSFLEQQNPRKCQDYPGVKCLTKTNYENLDLELQRLEEETRPEDSARFKTARIRKECESEIVTSRLNTLSRRSLSASTITLLANPNDDDNDDDDDPPTLERSPVSKLNFRSKKNSPRNRDIHKKNHHRKKITQCNSSPELSSQYESDPESEIGEIHPHPLVAQKILAIQTKISQLLDEISYQLGRIPRPDGDSDLRRRQQRVMEFGVRFSRNYLYDLGRQMSDIQRHLKAISQASDEKGIRRGILLHMQVIQQKLTSAHQLLLNALVAYVKHIPSSMLQGHPGKLKEVLQFVIEIKEICSKIGLTAEFFSSGDTALYPLGDDIQSRCCEILAKLHSTSDNDSMVFSHRAQSTRACPPVSGNRRKSQRENRKAHCDRLSMYYVDSKPFKNPRNRRPVTVGVYPKERRQNVARMPFNNPPPTPEQTYSNPVTQKSCKTRRKFPIDRLLEKDQVKTMMEMMPAESDAGSSGGVSRKFSSTTASKNKLRRQVKTDKLSRPTRKSSQRDLERHNNDTEEIRINEKHLSNFVPVIADILSLVADKTNEKGNSPSDASDSLREIIDKYRKLEVSEKQQSENNTSVICLNEEKWESRFVDAACQADQENLLSIERKNCRKTKLIVNKASAEMLLNYRDEYYRACKSSLFFRGKGPNKPWELLAWITDKLVEELLVSISKELEMESVIRRLFDLEFQEF